MLRGLREKNKKDQEKVRKVDEHLTYCVIRREDKNCGLFSFFITNLGGIHYSIINGKIPVIDMQNVHNIYLSAGEYGKVNAWEKYFEQPAGITLEDIRDKENIEYIDGCTIIRPNLSMDFITNEGLVRYWRNICRKYVRFNPKVGLFVEECARKVFNGRCPQNIVGVLCRGTDYVGLRPHNHPVQPDCDMIIDKVIEIVEANHCDAVYLASEDAYIMSRFREKLGGLLLDSIGEKYSGVGNEYLADFFRREKTDSFKQGLDYLASIYCLSRCGYLIAGRTSGSVAAFLLSEGFRYYHFWNLGVYGVDDEYSRKGYLV